MAAHTPSISAGDDQSDLNRGTTVDGNHPEDAIAQLKHEHIVLILPASEETNGGYLIYSLAERSPDEGGGNPFNFSVVHSQLPEESPLLAEYLLDRDSLPPSHLRQQKPDGSGCREVHVVVSVRSGLRLAGQFYYSVVRPLLKAVGLGKSEEEGDGYRITVTNSPNTIREFARELGTGEKTVVLLSGDGGVVDLLNGLDQAETLPTIALLPLGTGNALFHSLHKPHYAGSSPKPYPLVLGLRTLFRGTAAPLPTFRASFSPGARLVSAPAETGDESAPATATNDTGDSSRHVPVDHLLGAIVASYGFHASLVWESDTPAYRNHGDKRFGMAAAELLKVAHAYDATVEVRRSGSDDFVRLTNHHGGGTFNYVLATLVSNLEKTFTISPASKPLDGRLRLVHFGDVGGEKTMEIMMAAYRDGEHVRMGEVGYEEVEEVRVTIGEEDARWRKLCVDGSIVEVERGGWMRVRREERGRLRVVC
jgi:diacylglycerol kinase family enzyme